MLRKAKEKAKEGLRSVNETKRYIQTRARHGHHASGKGRPRQSTNSSLSAAVSFNKGFNDDFEAILNDESDFLTQLDLADELEGSGSGIEEDHGPSSLTVDGDSQTVKPRNVQSDLFSDPIFPESEHDPHEHHDSTTSNVDPLLGISGEDKPQTTSVHSEGGQHPGGGDLPPAETDTVTIPKSEKGHLGESDHSASSSSDNAVLSERGAEMVVPAVEADTPDPLRPDSPLFSDDVMSGSTSHKDKEEGEGEHHNSSRLDMNIFVTQPSNESPRALRKHLPNESDDDHQTEGGENNQTTAVPMLNTPDLPDIEELERKLAVDSKVHTLGGGQDFFSSEESPFSSLASSYEGEKTSELSHLITATFPSTGSASQIKYGHNEGELFGEPVSSGGKEVSGDSLLKVKTFGSKHAVHTIDEELEILLTPKQRSKTSEESSSTSSPSYPAVSVVDDPLRSSTQPDDARTEQTRSHLDSGVFEQSANSVAATKSTLEGDEEAVIQADDLFQIDEDHFKDDDATPVLSKRKLTKGASNIEVSQSKKSLYSTLSAPDISPTNENVMSPSLNKKRSPAVKAAPPPRPALSPKLKHRMTQKQQPGSSGASVLQEDSLGIAKKKVVQPLGQAPERSDEVGDHVPDKLESLDARISNSKAAIAAGSSGSPSSARSEETRIPADDLFLEDNLVSSNSRESGQPSETPRPDRNKAEAERAGPGDEELDYYFTYHLFFACCLYFYYSLNVFPYLSGFFAGFFVLYLTVGSVFIFYVQTVEKYQTGGGTEDKQLEPSQEFTERMHVDFDSLRVYKSKRFTATLTYDPTTHHPSDRMKAVVNLVNDFELYLRVYSDHPNAHSSGQLVDVKTDIRTCKITLVPEEVAKNRKRRWSKKFPIMIFNPPPNTYRVYLFSPHARDKEDWYRRLKHANSGHAADWVIRKEKKFFAYMENYFPLDSFPAMTSASSRGSSTSRRHSKQLSGAPRKSSEPRVRYSVNPETDEVSKNELSESVSFKGSAKAPPSQRQLSSVSHGSYQSHGEPSHGEHQHSHTRSISSTSVYSDFEVIPRPPKLTKTSQLQWLNAVAARLCWDIWHEQRWKDWVTTRIQKKLIRVKTPSFMEQLRLTGVDLGNDMPVVQQLREGPKLDLRGIWVFLDVTYTGNFVMTIETKMKFGKENQVDDQQMTTITNNRESGLPQSAPHRPSGHHHSTRSSGRGLSHHNAVKALGTPVDADDQEIDSGSDDEESATGLSLEVEAAAHSHEPHDHSAHLPGGRKDKLISMVSRITKKVANTKIVQRAAQKVSSYPLVLTVEVKQLDGVLAVNIPPPPTDTIWYGFKSPPNLKLVAKPRLGNREVKLSRVTHWIERKLRELVNKKLVLPEMEDLVIPILNSGIPEDELKPISSDSTPSAT